MSKRRKKQHVKARRREGTQLFSDLLHELLLSDEAKPPPGMLDAYQEVAEYTADDPHGALEIMRLDEQLISGLVAGIAYHERYGFPEHECLQNAKIIKWWAIMKGFVYMSDWEQPISIMTDEQIVQRIRADRDAGLIPVPTTD